MGIFEDKVKKAIKRQYGSVPRMSMQTGIPATTIYHALERGLDNTTTKTRYMILDALFINDADVLDTDIDSNEKELVRMYRELPDNAKNAVLAAMHTFLEES